MSMPSDQTRRLRKTMEQAERIKNSVLSEQTRRLRKTAEQVERIKNNNTDWLWRDGITLVDAVLEMRDAADTIDELRERLALKTCRRVYHPSRTRVSGPQYTCSACGYGASDDRWLYCPKCGSEYGNSRADARDEAGYE